MKADLPGVERKDVKITIEDGQLRITSERATGQKTSDENGILIERFHGTFSRTFALQDNADDGNIRGGQSYGTLAVHIPKTTAAKPATIEKGRMLLINHLLAAARWTLTFCGVAAGAIPFLAAAHAGVITTTTTKSFQDVTSGSASLSFERFDANLGVLIGVEVSASYEASSDFGFFLACQPFLPCVGFRNGVLTGGTNFSSGTISVTDSTEGSEFIFCSGRGFCPGFLAISDSILDFASDGDTLRSFSAPGAFSISFVADMKVDGRARTLSDFDGRATVKYTYGEAENVPEPATLTLVSLGMLGAAAVRRRTRVRP